MHIKCGAGIELVTVTEQLGVASTAYSSEYIDIWTTNVSFTSNDNQSIVL